MADNLTNSNFPSDDIDKTKTGQNNGGNPQASQNLTDEDHSKGGKASHQKGEAHEFDSDEAREAGDNGGSH